MKGLNQAQLLDQARMLASRLEKLSADSRWARRSSGTRGGLLKWIERLEAGPALNTQELSGLQHTMAAGYYYLEQGAREVA